MSSLGLIDKDKSPPPEDFDMKMASRLYNELQSRRLLYGKAKLKVWSKEFTTLRKTFTEEEIASTLSYYISHIGEEYMPEAYSARAFKEKFARIRAKQSILNPFPSKIEISLWTKKFAKQRSFDWPADEGKDELQFIELNYRYFYSFQKRLIVVRKELRDAAILRDKELTKKRGRPSTSSENWRLSRAADNMFIKLDPPETLTRWWAEYVNNGYHLYQWDTNLHHFVLNDNNPKWRKKLARIAAEYSPDWKLWEDIFEIVRSTKLEEEK